MEREPTEDDVRRAWSRFNRSGYVWRGPSVKFRLDEPMSVHDVVVNNDPQQPIAVRFAIATVEVGRVNGDPAERIVATVPGTNLSVELGRRYRK